MIIWGLKRKTLPTAVFLHWQTAKSLIIQSYFKTQSLNDARARSCSLMLPSKKNNANLLTSLFVVHTNSIPIVKFNFPQQKKQQKKSVTPRILEFNANQRKPTVIVNCDFSDVTASQLPRRPSEVSPSFCQKKYFLSRAAVGGVSLPRHWSASIKEHSTLNS